MNHVFEMDSGLFIVAHWDERSLQWRTFDCLDGYLYAFARTLEQLAHETGRTYENKADALAVAKELYQ